MPKEKKQKKELTVISFVTERDTGITRRWDSLSPEERDRLSNKMMENVGRGMSEYYQNLFASDNWQ